MRLSRRALGQHFLSLLCVLTGAGGCAKGDGREVMSGMPTHHLANGKFRNLYFPASDKPLSELIKWQTERKTTEPIPLTVDAPDLEFLHRNRTKPSLTWIGHATLLLQYQGLNILTDPHFTDRASPVSFLGPKRFTPPGLKIEDLPPIDLILISHNHYDHLDTGSIKALRDRFDASPPRVLVPLRLKSWFDDLGVKNVAEYDWWESEAVANKLAAHAVPARHWSNRGFNAKETLWCGWVLKFSDGFQFHFVGDTGASPVFNDIYQKFGPIDLAAIPIGAYEPRWFMKSQHINPEEAVDLHLQLHAQRSVGIHWGTFQLTDEPSNEPPIKLAEALKAKGLSDADIFTMMPGETRHI